MGWFSWFRSSRYKKIRDALLSKFVKDECVAAMVEWIAIETYRGVKLNLKDSGKWKNEQYHTSGEMAKDAIVAAARAVNYIKKQRGRLMECLGLLKQVDATTKSFLTWGWLSAGDFRRGTANETYQFWNNNQYMSERLFQMIRVSMDDERDVEELFRAADIDIAALRAEPVEALAKKD